MAEYVSVDGYKVLELDDGDLVPASVAFSLEGGTLVKLPDDQIADLQTVTFPVNYPLPSSQVTDLKTVAVSNFPAAFNVSNFPASFSVSNLPSTYALPSSQVTDLKTVSISNLPSAYPLSSGQAASLSAIESSVADLDRGSGSTTVDTLRTHVSNFPSVFDLGSSQASDLNFISTRLSGITSTTAIVTAPERATTGTITSVSAAIADTALRTSSATRRVMTIYNNSTGNMHVALGGSAASTSNFSFLLRPGDYWVATPQEASLEARAWFTTASGTALITTS